VPEPPLAIVNDPGETFSPKFELAARDTVIEPALRFVTVSDPLGTEDPAFPLKLTEPGTLKSNAAHAAGPRPTAIPAKASLNKKRYNASSNLITSV